MTDKQNRGSGSESEILKNYTERMPGAALILRQQDGKILYANSKALRLLECRSQKELDEWSGGIYYNLVAEEDQETVRLVLERSPRVDAGGDPAASLEEQEEFELTESHVSYHLVTRTGQLKSVIHAVEYREDPVLGRLCYLILYLRTGEDTSIVDELTGLPGMQSAFNYALRMAADEDSDLQRYCIYVNLAGFKRYNLKFGFIEGNKFLRATANILKECFPGDMVARFFADHFGIFTTAEDIEERLVRAHDRIQDIRRNAKVEMKAGIFLLDESGQFDPGVAVQYSKTACDMIRDDPSAIYQIYNVNVARQVELQQYIEDNINKAIRKKQIKVYFQPVIRTITGDVCSFEALTRWISPWYGFLSPGDFIPILEESHQIHKLDNYVVHEICRMLREEEDAGRPAVPISFNLSGLDFLLSDPFEEIEKAVKEYNIQRDMLRIEITESVIAEDRENLKREIDKFHEAGYQIWMDDFGSGYSSLNLLKDYHFDTLKIDMEFLRNFSDVSRKIVASTTRMAKNINTNTVAEGVETREQVDFLRSIGCGMLQGFYYGKPAPYEEALKNCREKGLKMESRKWRRYYDAISMVDVQTESPLYISEYNGESIHIIFDNEACKKLWYGVGYKDIAYDEVKDDESYDKDVYTYVRAFLDRNEWHVGEEPKQLVLMDRDHLIFDKISLIAENEGVRAFCVYISDITHDQQDPTKLQPTMEDVDRIVRKLVLMYDNVMVLNLSQDTIETEFQDLYFNRIPGTSYSGVKENLRNYAETMIYPPDLERFSDVVDPDTLPDRIRESSTNSVFGLFRVRDTERNYLWKIYTFILVPSGDETVIMMTVKDSEVQSDPTATDFYNKYYESGRSKNREIVVSVKGEKEEDAYHPIAANLLADSIVSMLPQPLYWKDSELRYAGMNRMFMEYFGIREPDEILGKTDQDLNWGLHNFNIEQAEKRALAGETLAGITDRRLVRGSIADVTFSALPLYSNGKIIGILARLLPLKNDEKQEDSERQSGMIAEDLVTKTNSSTAILSAMTTFNQARAIDGINYDILLVSITSYRNAMFSYGREVAFEVLRRCGEEIREAVGNTAYAGILGNTTFLVLRQERENMVPLYELERDIISRLESIRSVDDRDITVHATIEELNEPEELFQSELFLNEFRADNAGR
ncbi:MAG: EAL domain-containing protein [Anaerovoracaceae bacterium]|jgi:EAL domain-containing protein (putative c-di-GMP-specific phosphodiesterase class I)/GGDEF domain-containing protein